MSLGIWQLLAFAVFLALLTKYRKRRPLNGVIVTLNAEELIVRV